MGLGAGGNCHIDFNYGEYAWLAHAVQLYHEHPDMAVGVHLNLTCYRPYYSHQNPGYGNRLFPQTG